MAIQATKAAYDKIINRLDALHKTLLDGKVENELSKYVCEQAKIEAEKLTKRIIYASPSGTWDALTGEYLRSFTVMEMSEGNGWYLVNTAYHERVGYYAMWVEYPHRTGIPLGSTPDHRGYYIMTTAMKNVLDGRSKISKQANQLIFKLWAETR